MASIPHPDPNDPAVAAVLNEVRSNRGAVGSFHTQMAHVPALVEAFERYSAMIRTQLPLEFELFGLVVLRTVQLQSDTYEWPICVSIGRKGGIDDAKIIELWDWRNSAHFTPRQKAALAIVDEHVGSGRSGRRTAAAAALGTLTEREIIGVCAVMGWFLFIGSFTLPLELVPASYDVPFAMDAERHENEDTRNG
jgi:alkylhydroperoxidase family enzyme